MCSSETTLDIMHNVYLALGHEYRTAYTKSNQSNSEEHSPHLVQLHIYVLTFIFQSLIIMTLLTDCALLEQLCCDNVK